MSTLLEQLRARPHLLVSALVGVAAGAVIADVNLVTRLLIGWNIAVWLYLAQAFWIMSRNDHHHLRRTAIAQAEGAGAVLAMVMIAALASMAAIAVELATAKGAPRDQAMPHVLLALVTVAGSWLLLPTLFALSYASLYYQHPHGQGLLFPTHQPAEHEPSAAPPAYWDFLYFSFTIAVASQTADVAITGTLLRRLVLLQSVLSFAFNTAILALTINIAAGLL